MKSDPSDSVYHLLAFAWRVKVICASRKPKRLFFATVTFTKGWTIMADNTDCPPSRDLVSLASPTPSGPSKVVDVKTPPTATGQYPSTQWSPYSHDTATLCPPPRSQFIRQPAPIPIPPIRSIFHYSRSSPLQILRPLKPWLPLIFYAITSLGFVTAIAFYRTELFTCMS